MRFLEIATRAGAGYRQSVGGKRRSWLRSSARDARKRWAEIFNKELRSADAQRPDLLKLRPMLIRAFSRSLRLH